METTAVVDLTAARKARRLPTGTFVRCIACGHRWHTFDHADDVWLKCPDCDTLHGLREWPIENAGAGPHHRCDCGCALFTLTEGRALCCNCGADQAVGPVPVRRG